MWSNLRVSSFSLISAPRPSALFQEPEDSTYHRGFRVPAAETRARTPMDVASWAAGGASADRHGVGVLPTVAGPEMGLGQNGCHRLTGLLRPASFSAPSSTGGPGAESGRVYYGAGRPGWVRAKIEALGREEVKSEVPGRRKRVTWRAVGGAPAGEVEDGSGRKDETHQWSWLLLPQSNQGQWNSP